MKIKIIKKKSIKNYLFAKTKLTFAFHHKNSMESPSTPIPTQGRQGSTTQNSPTKSPLNSPLSAYFIGIVFSHFSLNSFSRKNHRGRKFW